jgi:hypothetical protein
MIKQAREQYQNYLFSIGMEKTATLEKYLPWALGAGLLGTGAYGMHRLMNPPTMWDRTKDIASSLGGSVKDLGKDIATLAQNNPQLLGTMMGHNTMYGMAPQGPQGISTQPHIQNALDIQPTEAEPYHPDPTVYQERNNHDLERLMSMQNQLNSFSPYQI